MKRDSKLEIYVFANWKHGDPVFMGTLSALRTRGKEIFSFEYSKNWLSSEDKLTLDPQLQFFSGEQFNKTDQVNFGIFLDSSPDRWGRILQKKREAQNARIEKRAEILLLESDYLLGVHDTHRMGALRFKTSLDGPFLNNSVDMSVPPITSLRSLESAAWALENKESNLSNEQEKWIRMLVAPGGSLGGARPKASVMDDKNNLWIAKFPSREDQQDTGLWEYLVHKLAKQAGVAVPEAEAKIYKGPHHTFLSKRFDRTTNGQRIHFASAMTLLGKTDGASGDDGTSYLELAEFLMSSGSQVDLDLEQLWRRILFNICVSNTDDHLRNHGFLLDAKGWRLSPAYDINPNTDGEGLKLNISETDNSQDLELALSVAPFFRISIKRANEIKNQVVVAVSSWSLLAKELGINRAAQAAMSRAFRLVEG
jgi:serine/threonine-protein kinase HipA